MCIILYIFNSVDWSYIFMVQTQSLWIFGGVIAQVEAHSKRMILRSGLLIWTLACLALILQLKDMTNTQRWATGVSPDSI